VAFVSVTKIHKKFKKKSIGQALQKVLIVTWVKFGT
jgi:hypothetical protein